MHKFNSPNPSGDLRDGSDKYNSANPGGSASGQNGEGVPLHKRMAQGYTPSASGPKTRP